MQFTMTDSHQQSVPVTPDTVTILVTHAGLPLDRVSMPGEVLTIGRADFCELQLDVAEVPLVHSEVICDGGVLRIEAAGPETLLEINGRRVSRLALRDGDRITVGGFTLSIEIGQRQPLEVEDRHALKDDYSHLSASELCDLILSEQSEIEEFETRREGGLRRLVSAIESSWLEGIEEDAAEDQAVAEWSETPAVFIEKPAELPQPLPVLDMLTPTTPAAMTPVLSKLDDLLLQFQDSELRASA